MSLHPQPQRRFQLAAFPWLLAVAALLLITGCRPIQADGGRRDERAAITGQNADEQPEGDQQAGNEDGVGGPADGERGDGGRGEGGQRADVAAVAPPVTWDSIPTCENHPQALAAWRAEVEAAEQNPTAAADLDTLLDQMHRYTRLLPEYSAETLDAALAANAADNPEASREQAILVLWLNLASERLNRATAIDAQAADAPAAPPTVGDLVDQLAAAEADGAELADLLALTEAVNEGQQLRVQVCAQVVYRAGTELYTALWNDQGTVTSTQMLSAPVGFTSFSPDHTRLVVQTPRGDTAGGPLYLYDLTTEETTNLNEHSGLPNYSSVSALKVVGWHPNNNNLLVANEDDEVILWLDLTNATFEPVRLDIDSSGMAPPRGLMLAPDGSGFVFLTYDRATNAANLFWHDLEEGSTRLLLTVPPDGGKLEGLQISPNGQEAAFVLRKGSRKEGRSEEIHLISLVDGSTRVLLSGPLGPVLPVWSPSGEKIAFVRRNLDQPLKSGPHAVLPLGDIWTLTVATGEMEQLTFTQAIERPPVWSPAGDYLAFVTAAGEIGMVSSTQPDVVWSLGVQLQQPQLTRIGFLP